MAILIGHASIDENGKISGGSVGDQTGKEVCIRNYYMHSKGWILLRPKSIEHAELIADAMIRACNNKNIGYDQGNRLGIIKYGTNTKVKTECDCSSLVRQCVIEATGKDPGNFTTANEVSKLEATSLFEKGIVVTSATTLYDGDILVTKTKGHTVIVVSGRTRKTAVLEWQKAAIKDGFKFPRYGADGEWGAECEDVAEKAIVKKRLTYKYRNLTKIVQKAVGVTADGKCGKNTRAAIIAYQKKRGLTADGCVGLKTWKKILGV